MPRIRKTNRILLLAVGLLLTSGLLFAPPVRGQTAAQAGKGKGAATPAPATAELVGVIVDLVKNETNNVGTVTVKGNAKNAKPVTFDVIEATRFEYFNQVNAWGTNFLAEHRGAKVAIFTVPGGKPLVAAKVQILLPPPQPRNPGPPPQPAKPSWARGTVVDVKDGSITIKLPNYTPPPPVRGTVTDVGVTEDTSLGVITVRANGKLQSFVVDPTTEFQKLKGKNRVRVSFLSIDQGETVEIFTRYGAPHSAHKVDVLLKQGSAEAAIVYKDHFLTFATNPATTYEIDRTGKLTPVSLGTVAKGESVAILPDGLRSYVAVDVRIVAPPVIHGVVESGTGAVLTVKVKEKGQEQAKTVAINAATKYEIVSGKTAKPGGRADAKPGMRVEIWPGVAPPNVAEKVMIHLGKPLSLDGQVVSASANQVTIKINDKGTESQKSFPLNAATKLEALEGAKRRPAKATELKAGQKVRVVAAAETPNAAHSVEIHIVPKTPPKKDSKSEPKKDAKKETKSEVKQDIKKDPKQTNNPKKAPPPLKAGSLRERQAGSGMAISLAIVTGEATVSRSNARANRQGVI